MKIEIANVQQKYKFFWISFYFLKNKHKQSGAAEACWSHNPEVRRSKLRSARQMFFSWCNIFSKNFFVHSRLEQIRIDGSVVECSLATGSIPGRCSTSLVRNQKYICKRVVWSDSRVWRSPKNKLSQTNVFLMMQCIF